MTRRVTGGALPALIVVGGLAVATVLAGLVVAKGDLIENDGQATTYLLSGRADIPAGQVQDDVIVARGVVTVDGTVEDDVLVVSGRARITGVVHGDVTVLRGSARVGADAEIDGDLRTSRPPSVNEDAVVRGDIADITALSAAGELPRSLWFALWLAAGLTVLVAGFVVPRPVATAAHEGVGRPGRAMLLGGLVLVAGPLVVAVLTLSLLGVGLAVVLAGALALAGAVGAAAAAVSVGRLAGLPEGPVSFLAGWAALGAGLALALLATPLLALLVVGSVMAFGLGSLIPARPRAERQADAVDDEDDHGLDDELTPVPPTADDDDDEPRILASFPIGAGIPN